MRRLVAFAIALPALTLTAPAGAVASSGETPLAVSVTDAVAEAAFGDTLTYTVVVENGGDASVSGSVNLRVPDFLDLAAPDAAIDGGTATWTVELTGGESVEFEAQATFARSPREAYQVVVLGELTDDAGRVVVRAADANRIPGSAKPEGVPGLTGERSEEPSWVPMTAGAALVVLVVGSALLGWLTVRRRRRGPNAVSSVPSNTSAS